MSDPMQGMPQGAPQGNAMRRNESVLSGPDLARQTAMGELSPEMPVVEFLQKNGIDPNGPVSQLFEWSKKQIDNRDPSKKMMNVAREAGPGMGQPAPQPSGGGLNDLMRGLNG